MYNVDVKEAIDRLIGYFRYGGVGVREDGLVDINVYSSDIKSLEELGYLVEVEVVRGFTCRRCKKLRDLRGSPKEVYGNFNCSICDNLKSLEGGPSYVGGLFYCDSCDSLINLLGSPRVVGGDFVCDDCKGLISLEGGPSEVHGRFDCSCCIMLKEIKFDLKWIGKILNCTDCKSLEYIDEDVISKVGGRVYVNGCYALDTSKLKKKFGNKIIRGCEDV